MPAASAPAPPAYDVCTPAQWDAWYTAIGVLGEGGTDFGLLETVGQELRTMERLPMGADGAVLMAADGAAVTPATQPTSSELAGRLS